MLRPGHIHRHPRARIGLNEVALGLAAMKADLRAGAARADAETERRFVAEVLPLWTAPETKERALAALRR